MRRLRAGLLLGVMDGAGGIHAHFVDRAHVGPLRDDRVGGVLAHLELGTLGLVFRLRVFVADRGVLVAGQNRTAFLLRTVGRADLHDLWFGGNGLCHTRREFGLVATGIGAPVALPAEVIPEQELVMPGTLGAVGATARRGDKLRIALVEGARLSG